MNQHQWNHAACASSLTLQTRRGVLKVSLATALSSLLGPTLGRVFAKDQGKTTNEKSIILLWLEGGPFQHESFDPKATDDERLAIQYKPILTSVPGIRFAASLPKLARHAHHMSVIRSMVGSEMEHNLAQYHMQTGWRNTGPISAPAIGSIVAHELGTQPMQRAQPDGLPAFISIGRAGYSSGHFGPAYKPTVVWDPNQPPENLGLPSGVTPEILDRRLSLLQAVEDGQLRAPLQTRFSAGRRSAVKFMRSSQRAAFDLNKESNKVRDEYGRSRFGQGCLLARRLVEAGVRFVQVTSENFDQHADHYPRQIDLFTQLDQGMSRLLDDLEQRGLLENTIVVAAGEFGRTPTFNGNKGRDHWIQSYSVAMAGGGFQGGAVHGSTRLDCTDVEEDPTSIPDFMATLCTAAGIDPNREYHDRFDRPIKLVDNGRVVDYLLI